MMRAAPLLLLLLAVSACTAIRWEGDRPVSDWTLATLFGLPPDVVSGDPIVPDVPVRTHLRA